MASEADGVEARREALSAVLATDDFRPSTSHVDIEIGARSHQGCERPSNEDHYLIIRLGRHQDTVMTSLPRADLPARFDECGYAMLVADGLGETGAGAVASRVALSALAHLAIHFGQWRLRIDPLVAAEIKERAEWYYHQANAAVTGHSRTHAALAGMATTVTAAYAVGADLFLAHVGHSRAYLYRSGALTQLTRDHTLAWQLQNASGPTSVDRGTQDLRHILTETIGGGRDSPLVDVEHIGLSHGDGVLLCTNGLTDSISEDRIAEVLTFRRTSQEQCRLLVDLALRADTQDNVTVILAQYAIRRT